MKKHPGCLCAALLLGLMAEGAMAETASGGLKIGPAFWKERSLYNDSKKDDSGMMMGPAFLLRLGRDNDWSLSGEALYGTFGDLDRADVDVMFGYEFSSMFTFFACFKYAWHDFGPSNDPDVPERVTTTGVGGGLGATAKAPLGDTGFLVFLTAKVMPMRMETDVPDADTTAWMWSYDGGIGYGRDLRTLSGGSVYGMLGYRHQQLRGGEFNETLQMPFIEAGFKQVF